MISKLLCLLIMCNRLGQEKKVVVHKLVTANSVEDHILRLATSKRQFNDVMLEEGTFAEKHDLTSKHIHKLFESIFQGNLQIFRGKARNLRF